MGVFGIFKRREVPCQAKRKAERESMALSGGTINGKVENPWKAKRESMTLPEAPEFRIRTHFTRKRIITSLAVFYLVAIPVYLYIGFQPDWNVAAAYAEEAKKATGSLEIPSISLTAPMSDVELDGRVLTAPDYIVGRYKAHENKILVMGHSSTIFKRLEDVELGDVVLYDGQSFKVVSRETKAKSEIVMREVLKDEEEPTIVLMTCAGEHISGQDYSHRLIIEAKEF